MKIERRKYACPVCEHELVTSTNHTGEIYTPCKKCGCSVLHCIEPQAVKDRNERKTVSARLVFFSHDISTEQGAKAWESIKDMLTSWGYEPFEAFQKHETGRTLRDVMQDDDMVRVYTHSIFGGRQQWITDRGRLHNWYMPIIENKRIKQGYYLEMGDELKTIYEEVA